MSLDQAPVDNAVRASVVSTLRTSSAIFLDAQWSFVQPVSSSEVPAISTVGLGIMHAPLLPQEAGALSSRWGAVHTLGW